MFFKTKTSKNRQKFEIAIEDGSGDVLVRSLHYNHLHDKIDRILRDIGSRKAADLEAIILSSPKYHEAVAEQKRKRIAELEEALAKAKAAQ